MPRTLALALAVVASLQSAHLHAQSSSSSLLDLSLEELSNVRVTSVSKAPQALATAPASISVVTREAIERSGATRLVEALRLAPNLHVMQATTTDWTVTARGLGGARDDQNFANKLLVLIDGRSVYSPLYSGVYWQAQDVPLADVERIEVISGPGATLWGANAVNGVVNVITRSSEATYGTRLQLAAGDESRHLEARYGGALGESASFRVYGLAFEQDELRLPTGGGAENGWRKTQGGFRLDWARGADSATFDAGLYRSDFDEPGGSTGRQSGGHALARWTRELSERSRIDVQAYFDQTQQEAPPNGIGFLVHTWDLQLQHTLQFGAGHQLVWGAGERSNEYRFANRDIFYFEPRRRRLSHGNVFAQTSLALPAATTLTLGLKFEDAPYTGWEALPDVRLSWAPAPNSLLWAAASRAIRAPTPFDRDVREVLGTVLFLAGGENFQPETLTAYQFGYRATPSERLSWAATVFYHEYDNLRTVELGSPQVLPLRWGNLMRGDTYGLELWGTWQPLDGWRLSPGYQWLRKRLAFEPGSSRLIGTRQAGNDPEHVIKLHSTWDVTPSVSLDATLRYVSSLPNPAVEAYTELDLHLGWRVTPSLTLSLRGRNLLHDYHRENPASVAQDIPRSGLLEARWEF